MKFIFLQRELQLLDPLLEYAELHLRFGIAVFISQKAGWLFEAVFSRIALIV